MVDGVLINWFDEVVENEYVHRVCEEYIYVHYNANCKGKKKRQGAKYVHNIWKNARICSVTYTGSNFGNFLH